MRIFKNKWFTKFARKEKIADERLVEAIKNADAGSIDADYGGGVIKLRIARLHEGKSGGYRTIILYRQGDKAFFVFGFAKSAMKNIDRADVESFKKLSRIILSLSNDQILTMLESGEIEEISK